MRAGLLFAFLRWQSMQVGQRERLQSQDPIFSLHTLFEIHRNP